MQRSYLTLALALIAAIWSTQCNSLSEDCKKTLTCGDAGAPRLNPRDCVWRFPDGGVWEDGPRKNEDGNWTWSDGSPAPTFQCSGGQGGSGGAPDRCTNPEVRCDPLYCDTVSTNCVECLNNTHCASQPDAGASSPLVCDPASHRCIECLVDRDCTGRAGTPYCLPSAADPTLNKCVACIRDSQCGNAQVCDEPTGECTLRCTASEDDCPSEKPVCDIPTGATEGVCVECRNDSTCTVGTPQCNTVTRECVQCTDDTPCGPIGRVCDTDANQCVPCTTDTHCEDVEAPRCKVATHACVECLEHTDCTNVAESRCNPGDNTCATCTQDDQCEPGTRCRVTDGRCVQCVDDSHCLPGENNRCDTTAGACVECVQDSDCPAADAARCDVAVNSPTRFTCVGCNAADGNSECSGKIPGGLCRGGDGLCVNCLENANCTQSGPGLSQCGAVGNCVACSDDDDCDLFTSPPRRACRVAQINPGCVECVSDSHCVNNELEPRCKLNNGGGPAPINTCVQCLSNADCPNPAFSLCSQNECVPCAVNGDCDIAGLGVCDTSSGDGVCVQCTGDQRQACAGGANVCNSTTRTCTTFAVGSATNPCATCVSDAHCSTSARCIQQTFAGTNVGFFCFPLQSAGSCQTRGFGQLSSATTIEDDVAAVCLQRETTCPAFADYGELQACASEADDAACGVTGLADGSCVPRGAGFVCSINCEFVDDCPTGICTNGACPQQ